MQKTKILFLAASPLTMTRMSLEHEIRAIEESIQAEHRECLELIPKRAVRPNDVIRALNQHMPHVVHFSAHGSESHEIVLESNDGAEKPVDADALRDLFEAVKDDNIRLVVFNACFGQGQAKAIVEIVDCAIGMIDEISDDAAIAFSGAFYDAIGYGRSIQQAFDLAKVAIKFERLPEDHVPKLFVKQNVDPANVVLVGGDQAAVDPPVNTAPVNTAPPTPSQNPPSTTVAFCVKAKGEIEQLKSETRKRIDLVSPKCNATIRERFERDFEKRTNRQSDFVEWLIHECPAAKAVSRFNGIAGEKDTSASDASTLTQISSRLIPLRYAEKIQEVRERLESNTFEIITASDRSIAEVILASFDGRPIQFHKKLGVTAFEYLESGDYGYGEARIDASVMAFFGDVLNAWDKRFGDYAQQSSGDAMEDLVRKLKARVVNLEDTHDRTVYCLLKLPEQEHQRRELEAILNRAAALVPNLVFCHVEDKPDFEDERLLACISHSQKY